MKKTYAIRVLGGSFTSASKAVGISYQAVRKWPDELSDRIADRVHAAVARRKAAATRASKRAAKVAA